MKSENNALARYITHGIVTGRSYSYTVLGGSEGAALSTTCGVGEDPAFLEVVGVGAAFAGVDAAAV